MDKKDYVEVVEEHIRTGPYKEYKSRMQFLVDKLQERVTEKFKELTERGLISERESRKLKVANPRMPRISGLPKIHKAGNQIRPVVTNVDAPTSKIAKFLVSKLKSIKREATFS